MEFNLQFARTEIDNWNGFPLTGNSASVIQWSAMKAWEENEGCRVNPSNKTPRDVSGDELAKRMSALGYFVTRQRGDHMRLTSNRLEKQHSITIPRQDPIRIGTLKNILRDVAEHQQLSRERLLEILFD